MQKEKHNCGGFLESVKLIVERDGMSIIVDGLRCTKCSEEVIERNVALTLEEKDGR